MHALKTFLKTFSAANFQSKVNIPKLNYSK